MESDDGSRPFGWMMLLRESAFGRFGEDVIDGDHSTLLQSIVESAIQPSGSPTTFEAELCSRSRFMIETAYCWFRIALFSCGYDAVLAREENEPIKKPLTRAVYFAMRKFVPSSVVRAFEASSSATMDADAFWRWMLDRYDSIADVVGGGEHHPIEPQYVSKEELQEAMRTGDESELALYVQFHRVGRRLAERFLRIISTSNATTTASKGGPYGWIRSPLSVPEALKKIYFRFSSHSRVRHLTMRMMLHLPDCRPVNDTFYLIHLKKSLRHQYKANFVWTKSSPTSRDELRTVLELLWRSGGTTSFQTKVQITPALARDWFNVLLTLLSALVSERTKEGYSLIPLVLGAIESVIVRREGGRTLFGYPPKRTPMADSVLENGHLLIRTMDILLINDVQEVKESGYRLEIVAKYLRVLGYSDTLLRTNGPHGSAGLLKFLVLAEEALEAIYKEEKDANRDSLWEVVFVALIGFLDLVDPYQASDFPSGKRFRKALNVGDDIERRVVSIIKAIVLELLLVLQGRPGNVFHGPTGIFTPSDAIRIMLSALIGLCFPTYEVDELRSAVAIGGRHVYSGVWSSAFGLVSDHDIVEDERRKCKSNVAELLPENEDGVNFIRALVHTIVVRSGTIVIFGLVDMCVYLVEAVARFGTPVQRSRMMASDVFRLIVQHTLPESSFCVHAPRALAAFFALPEPNGDPKKPYDHLQDGVSSMEQLQVEIEAIRTLIASDVFSGTAKCDPGIHQALHLHPLLGAMIRCRLSRGAEMPRDANVDQWVRTHFTDATINAFKGILLEGIEKLTTVGTQYGEHSNYDTHELRQQSGIIHSVCSILSSLSLEEMGKTAASQCKTSSILAVAIRALSTLVALYIALIDKSEDDMQRNPGEARVRTLDTRSVLQALDTVLVLLGNLMANRRSPSLRPMLYRGDQEQQVDRSPDLYEVARSMSSLLDITNLPFSTQEKALFALSNLARHTLIRAHLAQTLSLVSPTNAFLHSLQDTIKQKGLELAPQLRGDLLRGYLTSIVNLSRHAQLRSMLADPFYAAEVVAVLKEFSDRRLIDTNHDILRLAMEAVSTLCHLAYRPAQDFFGDRGAFAVARQALIWASRQADVELGMAAIRMMRALAAGDHIRNGLRAVKRGTASSLVVGPMSLRLVRLFHANNDDRRVFTKSLAVILNSAIALKEERPGLVSGKAMRLKARAVDALFQIEDDTS